MPDRPSVVVFDVNETLSDMAPLALRFQEVGAPQAMAKAWFAALLRDGFALATVGNAAEFGTIGAELLPTLLAGQELNRSTDEAVQHIMAGFRSLRVHSDVPDGVRRLRQAGLRLVTLTNGATQVAEGLFAAARIRDEFERLLSVEDAGIWKPARAAYEYAARTCGARLDEMILVAVHPWDINGAARAGMATAWLNRSGSRYPSYFAVPDITAASVADLAAGWPYDRAARGGRAWVRGQD